MNRRIVELDLESCSAMGTLKAPKEVLVQVAALNAIRSIINDSDLFSHNDFVQKYQNQNGFTVLLDTIIAFLKQSNNREHNEKIKKFFRNVLLTSAEAIKPDEISSMEQNKLFSANELTEIKRLRQNYCTFASMDNMALSPLCTMSDWKMSDSKGKTTTIQWCSMQFN